MSTVLNLLLVPPAYSAIRQRYRDYLKQGATLFTAGMGTLLSVLACAFLRLESPSWQRIRGQSAFWFPHISPQRPRPADPLRYLAQGLWLLVVRNGQIPAARRNLFSALPRWRQRYLNMMQQLPQRMGIQEAHADTQKPPISSLETLLLILLAFATTALAILCITQPLDLLAQFVFMLLLWGIAMLVRRVPGRLPTLMMIVLSLTVSSRYLWWRYTSTLNWDDPLSLICGLLLLLAETYAWIVLVLGFFQTL